jgi:hypothetical protein
MSAGDQNYSRAACKNVCYACENASSRFMADVSASQRFAFKDLIRNDGHNFSII